MLPGSRPACFGGQASLGNNTDYVVEALGIQETLQYAALMAGEQVIEFAK